MPTRYVCIHAHCYQPPRENPWLEAIEEQDSAHPYHDWNALVNAECYAQNVTARILDGDGRITRITNNYAHISFNFGPTLLAWIEAHDPATYRAIQEADAACLERTGHGAAIAQPYNHMIMPLANERDRRTQVRWGLRDFEHRFGRRAAGMWLPETAVDVPTLELLAEHGVAFTILSPTQARRVRPAGKARWQSVEGGKIDPSMAYRHPLPSGRHIDVFFYDGPVATAVAFEGLLDDGDRFADRLLDAFDGGRPQPQLAHIATDGESYGHHHGKGEMALAYALARIDEHDDAEVTVYGAFLAEHPPTHEVEIVEGTAWSCVHGLGRWRTDCGCSTGGRAGWHQRWRAPLRNALDWLRDAVGPRYEQAAAELLRDPWQARDDYIDVILDRSRDNVDAFFRGHARDPLTAEQRQRSLELLELQRNAMLMYTSCGWFFDELSGIETTQVMAYASRVVQLAADVLGVDLEPQLLDRLAEAPSNLPELGDGRAVYQRLVQPSVVTLGKVAAHYGVSSLFEDYGDHTRVFCYDVEREAAQAAEAGRMRLVAGRVCVRSVITEAEARTSYAVLYLGDTHVLGGVAGELDADTWQRVIDQLSDALQLSDVPDIVRVFDEHFHSEVFSLRSLFRDEQRKVVGQLVGERIAEIEAAYEDIYRPGASLLRFLADLNIPVPRPLAAAAEQALYRRFLDALDGDLSQARAVLVEASAQRVALDLPSLAFAAQARLEQLAEQLEAEPDDLDRLRAAAELAGLVRELPFEVELHRVQNTYWRLLGAHWHERCASPEAATGDWCATFRALGERLAVRVPEP